MNVKETIWFTWMCETHKQYWHVCVCVRSRKDELSSVLKSFDHSKPDSHFQQPCDKPNQLNYIKHMNRQCLLSIGSYIHMKNECVLSNLLEKLYSYEK